MFRLRKGWRAVIDIRDPAVWVLGWSHEDKYDLRVKHCHLALGAPHTVYYPARLSPRSGRVLVSLWDFLTDLDARVCTMCLYASPQDSEGLARCA